ncbi:MAG TPA: trypsin-like peptidase domain-containing protein [Acidimicrobiales bacterium]|nr:trypsin-like peptidase domain-containing protein [Acidimicrobiales bacterium]
MNGPDTTETPSPTPIPETPPTTPAPPPPPMTPPAASADRRRGRGWVPVVAASVLSAALASGATAALVDEPGPAREPAVAEQAVGRTVEPTAVADGADAAAVAADRVAPAVVQIQTRTGVGSGVVYDEEGLVLTVAHVVGNNRQVAVRTADGRSVEGEVLGTHEQTDIAVVRIDPDDVLAVADLATGEPPLVGQLAVAVGSPFGFDQTVTSGIVSAVDRVVNQVSMIQTDAAINPGNSGGPLVDADGAVLGLNDVIFSQSGGNEGIGFAIQIDLARIVADQIVAGEDVRLALLGVSSAAAPSGAAGAQVAEVVPGSAADEAGIEVGDLIVGLDGEAVADSGQLRARVITRAPGDRVQLELERDGERRTVEVALGSTS